MKCAVAIVLALIGMVVANPVPPLGLGYGLGSPLLLPSAVSVSSSLINHGYSIPKIVAPVITAPIIRTVAVPTIIKTAPISVGWGGYGGYGLGGGWGGYGLGGGLGGYGLSGGLGGYGLGGHGSWGNLGGLGWGVKGWH